MDTTAILHGLRLEQQIAEQRVNDLNAAIATFEKLQDGHRSISGGEKHASGTASKRKPVDWERARQMYENAGTEVPRIAQALKCHASAIYGKAKAEGWKRPTKG